MDFSGAKFLTKHLAQVESWRPSDRGMAVSLISSSAFRFRWVQGLQTTALGQDVALQWSSLDSLTLPNSLHHKFLAKIPLGISQGH